MAKAKPAARFVTEVAPPQVVSVMRRGKVPRSLDTIAEDDREHQLAYGPPPSSSDHLGFTAAWSRRAPPAPQVQARERAATGGFMRELSNYFSDAHGRQHQQGGATGGWDSGHKLGHRRAGHAPRRSCTRTVVHEGFERENISW